MVINIIYCIVGGIGAYCIVGGIGAYCISRFWVSFVSIAIRSALFCRKNYIKVEIHSFWES